MADYQLTSSGVLRVADGLLIPAHAANADWQRYEAWAAEGNTADPLPLPPAPTLAEQIAPTDYQMARGHEELVALLVSKGVIAAADIDAPGLANLNARRALRGEGPLGG